MPGRSDRAVLPAPADDIVGDRPRAGQDLPLELDQSGVGVQPQLVVQERSSLEKKAESVGLPAAVVLRPDQRVDKFLAEGVFVDVPLHLVDDCVTVAAVDLGFDAAFEGGQAAARPVDGPAFGLLEVVDDVDHRARRGNGERLPPRVDRTVQIPGGPCRVPHLDRPLEPVGVKSTRLDPQRPAVILAFPIRDASPSSVRSSLRRSLMMRRSVSSSFRGGLPCHSGSAS